LPFGKEVVEFDYVDRTGQQDKVHNGVQMALFENTQLPLSGFQLRDQTSEVLIFTSQVKVANNETYFVPKGQLILNFHK